MTDDGAAAPTFTIDAAGWLEAGRWPARRVPSPNRDARPDERDVTLCVVHNISLPPGEFGGPGIEALFTNRLDPDAHPYYRDIAALRVSAHFLVRRDGEVVQFVSCRERAWHAGASSFGGRAGCNDYSIGIELEGTDERPYEDVQYVVLAALVRALGRRWPIVAAAGHSEIAPSRKTDPGPAFDWARFASMGLGDLRGRDP